MKRRRDSARGIPILTVSEKCDALKYCMTEDANEDAEGHLWDLINYVYKDINNKPLPKNWVKKMVEAGRTPTPIEKD